MYNCAIIITMNLHIKNIFFWKNQIILIIKLFLNLINFININYFNWIYDTNKLVKLKYNDYPDLFLFNF